MRHFTRTVSTSLNEEIFEYLEKRATEERKKISQIARDIIEDAAAEEKSKKGKK